MNIAKLLLIGVSSLILSVQTATPKTLPNPHSQNNRPNPAASGQDVSRNWSGYSATSGRFTGVSGDWVVPEIRSGESAYGADATWVGIGGIASNDLIQAGTQSTVTPDGGVSYEAFYETLPDVSQPLSMSIRPGETMHVALTQTTKDNWHILIEDTTTGEQSSLSIPYNSSLSSAEWIEEAPSGMHNTLPLDNFGSIHFSNAFAVQNDNSVSLADTKAVPIAMGNGYGQILATSSDISQNGNSFQIDRQMAPAPSESAYSLELQRQQITDLLKQFGFSHFRGLRSHLLQ